MTKAALPPTLRAYTLGCKVNACDTNAVLEAAISGGFARAENGSPADVVIVNTCAVTARSVAKARGLIRRARLRHERALIILTGCAVRLRGKPLLGMPQVDFAFETPRETLAWLSRRYGLDLRLVEGGLDPDRTRAFLKIQDGCDALCSYCVVPLVRGKPQSLDSSVVISRLRDAVSRGYGEVVLTGIHLGQYGRDLDGLTLAGLLERIADEEGEFRVRLSSIEPLEVTPELLEAMASSSRFCPHLHMPLQSGSDRILAAMKRPYGRREYMAAVSAARSVLDNPAITTDIMVGFPGETHDDHVATLDAVAQAAFARSHVFVYSPRPGTAAESICERVEAGTAKRRSQEVRAAAAETARRFREGLVGTVAQVLPEEKIAERVEGFCSRYQRVRFAPAGGMRRPFEDVRISGAIPGGEGVLEGIVETGSARREQLPT